MNFKDRINIILDFWFGNSFIDEFPPYCVSDKWFSFEPITDRYIQKHFTQDVENALAGKYNSWVKTLKGRQALIILLDQFTRHIYRNTAAAFSGDQKALALAKEPKHTLMAKDLLTCEKLFYFGPFEHSEEIENQKIHMNIYYSMLEVLPESVTVKLDYYVYWFQIHYDVIMEFGRFPWRNDLLGRQSTQKEIKYLQNAPNFGQNFKIRCI